MHVCLFSLAGPRLSPLALSSLLPSPLTLSSLLPPFFSLLSLLFLFSLSSLLSSLLPSPILSSTPPLFLVCSFFSLDHRQSNLTRSTFYFQTTSSAAFHSWLTDTVVPLARASEGSDYRVLYYDGGYLFDWEVDQAVFNDARWSGLAFVTVFLFVWMHTRSFIVSFFGMLGVTASIPITLWIYKDCIGIDHVSILNFLSLFVIMGIGADDMFVFFDTYEVVAHEDPSGELEKDTPARLARTFSRAIAAMSVTSVSTAASFFANYVSSLPVIREFGIFMGLVVVVNFVIIVIYFPSLVIIADKVCDCSSSSSGSSSKRAHKWAAARRKLNSSKQLMNSSSNSFSMASREISCEPQNPTAPPDPAYSSSNLDIASDDLDDSEKHRGGDGSGMAGGAVPVAQLSAFDNADMTDVKMSSPAIMEAEVAILTTAKVAKGKYAPGSATSSAKKGGGTIADISGGAFRGAGGGGKPMLSQIKARNNSNNNSNNNSSSNHARDDGNSGGHGTSGVGGSSLRSMLGVSSSRDLGGTHYERGSFSISASDGWGYADRFFHNHWAPAIFSGRYLIFILTIGFVVTAAIMSVIYLVPADEPPSLFPPEHNIGMLELVNRDYVASSSMELDAADAQAWGLIEVVTGGEEPETPFCPTVDGELCDGRGSCNSLTGACVCFSGFVGTDCSTELESDAVIGNIVLSEQEWIITSLLGDPLPQHQRSLTLTNTGDAKLNWYFVDSEDQFGTFLVKDDSMVPPWLALSDYSGSVLSGQSEVLSVTFTPGAMECDIQTCIDQFEWIFTQTGNDGSGKNMLAKLTRATLSPTMAPTVSPTPVPTASPTPAPSLAPTPSNAPTKAPTQAPTSSPTLFPTATPTASPTTPLCTNGLQDVGETDVDCGGDCPKCAFGLTCIDDDDCSGNNCEDSNQCGAAPTASPTPSPTSSPTSSPTLSPTEPPTTSPTPAPTTSGCDNSFKDPGETDVDCGGPECQGCLAGLNCSDDADCESNICDEDSSICIGAPTTSPTFAPSVSPTLAPTLSPTTPAPTVSTCTDERMNGVESDIDCGGNVCPGCGLGGACGTDGDCLTNTCDGNSMCIGAPTTSPTTSPTQSPTTPAPTKGDCNDSNMNGAESDVDCGGSDCPGCGLGGTCGTDGDCLTNTCDGNNVCIGAPTSAPTASPTTSPTKMPSMAPTGAPSSSPTKMPSASPTLAPSLSPTATPTLAPTLAPTTSPPTLAPTTSPTQ